MELRLPPQLFTGLLLFIGCSFGSDSDSVQQDQFIEFKSQLGNLFVAPSNWKSTDKGDTFVLESPDGHAAITATIYTAEDSGSLSEFRETMTKGLLPTGATGWQPSEWVPIQIGDVECQKRVLIQIPEADQEWRVYVMSRGQYYHAIFLNSSATVMSLNGEFYESVVRTYEGIAEQSTSP